MTAWYSNAIIYELHVRAFRDSDKDGIGDFKGLTSRLDYLSDLGVTALWLLPFYPSPLRDGGYDIADYTGVNPVYGTLDDFRRFLDEAHLRGLKVITELVINHTSADHAWFQRARNAPAGSPERDFYVWSDTPDRYPNARIIFKDFETSNWTWDPVARQYYWHRFYSHQPDLNFDNPAVHDAVFEVLDTWLGYGVDGLRLDAVPYLYEREGTSCENLDETHAFLKKLRAHVDSKFTDRMLLAEANQWPSDAAAYFGNGDECHMNFHFPLMPRLFMAVEMEDRFPIVDILRQTPPIPEGCQWATFLRNHDELTLEMVTDEDRDYMYATYTDDAVARINLGIRRRLAPLVRLRGKIELLNGLLFSLPGSPVIYYGDEIGMGDNVYLGDRDGVRTPMQWSPDRNAGFSEANPQRLYLPVSIDPEYHYEAVNVDSQQTRPGSLLRWMKQLIDVRKQDDIFALGSFDLVQVDNPRVLAFVRAHGSRALLVVCNLSRHPQHANIDLSGWAGRTPLELFGRSAFPTATDRPYPLSFAPYQFYWFQLEQPAPQEARPSLVAAETWTAVIADRARMAKALSRYATGRRWFRGKAKTITASRLADVLKSDGSILFCVVEITYADGASERYLVPVGFALGEQALAIEQGSASAVIAGLTVKSPAPSASTAATDAGGAPLSDSTGILYDALATGDAAAALLEAARGAVSITGEGTSLVVSGTEKLDGQIGTKPPAPRPIEIDQTNSSVPFGDRVIMKIFRQLEEGQNAEIEIGTRLSENPGTRIAPLVLGAIHWNRGSTRAAAAVIHEYVENQGTAWELLLRDVEALFEKTLAGGIAEPAIPPNDPFALFGATPDPQLLELAGPQVRYARLLGERTAAMHNVLGAVKGPDFAPEPFNLLHQQSLFQGARSLLVRTFENLDKKRTDLPTEVATSVLEALKAQRRVEGLLQSVAARPLRATRIRTHGDLHLGQVLFTGVDFVIIDFEGEPARPPRERRYKRCLLRDAAGMMRSFSYVAEAALRAGRLRERDVSGLRPWATAWTRTVAAAFLESFLKSVEPAFVPPDLDTTKLLLAFYTAEKCVYEIAYELNNRPAWLPIPIAGLFDLLDTSASTPPARGTP